MADYDDTKAPSMMPRVDGGDDDVEGHRMAPRIDADEDDVEGHFGYLKSPTSRGE